MQEFLYFNLAISKEEGVERMCLTSFTTPEHLVLKYGLHVTFFCILKSRESTSIIKLRPSAYIFVQTVPKLVGIPQHVKCSIVCLLISLSQFYFIHFDKTCHVLIVFSHFSWNWITFLLPSNDIRIRCILFKTSSIFYYREFSCVRIYAKIGM